MSTVTGADPYEAARRRPRPVPALNAVRVIGRGAVLSPCGTHRYSLWREYKPPVDARPGTMLWIMLNPSDADADVDDPTMRRVAGFTTRAGYARAEVVNLYSIRSPYPAYVDEAAEAGVAPVGPDALMHVAAAVQRAAVIVCAWGANPARLRARPLDVIGIVDAGAAMNRLYCLGVTRDGYPMHPVRLPNATTFHRYQPVWPSTERGGRGRHGHMSGATMNGDDFEASHVLRERGDA